MLNTLRKGVMSKQESYYCSYCMILYTSVIVLTIISCGNQEKHKIKYRVPEYRGFLLMSNNPVLVDM